MHWLQALDTSLFLFVNRSLANPVFDWLMPILSGNALFFPALFLLGVGLLWKGNVRMRLCLLLLLLILPLGDGLVTNTIKHAVARPRPFATLPEARLFGTVGKGYVAPGPVTAAWRCPPTKAAAPACLRHTRAIGLPPR